MTIFRFVQSRITTKMDMKTLYSMMRNHYKGEYMSVHSSERTHYKDGYEDSIFYSVESLQG
jgi:hypothetical protein